MCLMKQKMPQFLPLLLLQMLVQGTFNDLGVKHGGGISPRKLWCLTGNDTFLEHTTHPSHHWALPSKPSLVWLSWNLLLQPIKRCHVWATLTRSRHTITMSTKNLATWFSNDPGSQRLLMAALLYMWMHYCTCEVLLYVHGIANI